MSDDRLLRIPLCGFHLGSNATGPELVIFAVRVWGKGRGEGEGERRSAYPRNAAPQLADLPSEARPRDEHGSCMNAYESQYCPVC